MINIREFYEEINEYPHTTANQLMKTKEGREALRLALNFGVGIDKND